MLSLLIGNLFIAGLLAYPIAFITATTTNLHHTTKNGRLDISRSAGRFVQHYSTIAIWMYISFIIIGLLMKVIY